VPVVTMLNQKGGVGKTSTCHHLGGTLALLGKRTLLVDNDPQASLTQGFWGPQATRQLELERTIAAVYRGDLPFPDSVIRPTGIVGIDIVPGSRHATEFNVPLPHRHPNDLQLCLKEFLAEVRESYDIVLIDCPPNLHMASWASLAASEFLVVPLKPEDYGAQGIIEVNESVQLVRSGPNPGLVMLGYLLTLMTPRKSVHQMYEEGLRAQYGDLVFETRVTEAVEYVEALNHRKPVAQYKPKGAAARTMKALAEELLGRVMRSASATQEAA
jgi:chromosome partitioning protein